MSPSSSDEWTNDASISSTEPASTASDNSDEQTTERPSYTTETAATTESTQVFFFLSSESCLFIQAPFTPYGNLQETTKASPPKIIYLTVSSNRSEFCVGRGDAMYRDPQACSGIIQCHGGEMFQHNGCPSGLVFNERKQQCDYKNQVPECDRLEQNPTGILYFVVSFLV